LAHGYDLVGTALTLHLCDPNRPQRLRVRVPYAPATPPP